MSDDRPFLAAAFTCERVLEEKDRVLSVVRIVDTFYVQPTPPNLPPEAVTIVALYLLLSFKKSKPDKNTAEVMLSLHTPSGQPYKLAGDETGTGALRIPLTFQPDDLASSNVVLHVAIPPKEYGTYTFDVVLEGELVTKVPFRLLPQPSGATQQ